MGTLEEILEVLTWTQLGIHEKPCGLLNAAGYFDNLVQFLNHAERELFIRSEHRSMLMVDEEPTKLLDQLETYEQPVVDKAEWILSLTRGVSA